jgi:CheY-like chemotaxis protein
MLVAAERAPLRSSSAPQIKGRTLGPSSSSRSRTTRGESSPVRVLLIDDDPAFLRAATRALATARPSFAVTTAMTGAAAVAMLDVAGADENDRPDLIVLDYHLPDTVAPNLLRHLTASGSLRDVPVLVLTRDERERARGDALAAGARAFAAKPSRVRALREVIVHFWEVHGGLADDPAD